MTTTATPTKSDPAKVAATLARLDKRVAEAREEAAALSREHYAKRQQADALADERRRTIYRDPGLVDHAGAPTAPDNAVGRLDAAAEQLGDLEELRARADHAGKILAAKIGERDAHVRDHLQAILAAVSPAQRKRRDELVASIAATEQLALGYLADVRGTEGYLHAHGGHRGVRVPGLDAAAELIRRLEGWDGLPVPAEVEL